MQIKTIYKNLSYLYCQDSNFTHFVLSISLWHLLVKQLFMLGKFVYLPGSGQVDPSKIRLSGNIWKFKGKGAGFTTLLKNHTMIYVSM